MALFKAYRDDIDGNIDLLIPYFNADTRGKEKRLEVFRKHGIDLNKERIYPMQTLLNYLKDVSEELGEMNVFSVGYASAYSLDIKNFKNFKDVVEQLNIIYHTMYTIKGKPLYDPKTKTFESGLGAYTVTVFDEQKKRMEVKSTTPFHSKFDEAVLMGLCERFRKPGITSTDLYLDITKERRATGGDSCTYIVTWK